MLIRRLFVPLEKTQTQLLNNKQLRSSLVTSYKIKIMDKHFWALTENMLKEIVAFIREIGIASGMQARSHEPINYYYICKHTNDVKLFK